MGQKNEERTKLWHQAIFCNIPFSGISSSPNNYYIANTTANNITTKAVMGKPIAIPRLEFPSTCGSFDVKIVGVMRVVSANIQR